MVDTGFNLNLSFFLKIDNVDFDIKTGCGGLNRLTTCFFVKL